ncbi:MAG: hypothetical protein R3F59_29205 [Myxococcota bacterium]
MLPYALAAAAAAAPPDADALLALPRVFCRALDAPLTWARVDDPRQWVLSEYGDQVTSGYGDTVTVDRRPKGRPTRLDRPHAPWTWTERIRLRGDATRVAATFRCVDATDPASPWTDVEAWWTQRPGAVPPPGLRRCRADDRDVAWVESGWEAGVPPYPGAVTHEAWLLVDHLRVGHVVVHAPWRDDAPPGDEVTVTAEVTASERLPTADPALQRTREEVTFRRPDGSPILSATLTCEAYDHPPMP